MKQHYRCMVVWLHSIVFTSGAKIDTNRGRDCREGGKYWTLHHVSKNVPPLACYNFDTHEWIMIFLAVLLPIE